MNELHPKHRIGKLLLLTATVIWGSSFVIVKDVSGVLSPNTLLAIRFPIAALILSLIFIKRFRHFDKKYLIDGAICGVLLYIAYSLQTFGISFPENTPGKNAFLTAVYCVLVPFFNWFIIKKRPDKYHIIAALLCICGIGLVSLKNDFSVGIGDLLTLGGGVFFAFHIIALDRFSDNRDPILLTIVQFASSGVLSLISALTYDRSGSITFTPELIFSLAYLAVLCTAVTLLFQTIGQKYNDPSSSAIILSLEAVFGVAFSLLLGREDPTPKIMIGFAVIFIAILISETKLAFLWRLPLFKQKKKD